MDAKNVAKKRVLALGYKTGNAKAVFEPRKDGTVRVSYTRTISREEANAFYAKVAPLAVEES
jgi:uncharacterized DUF497 family protein